MTAPVDELIFVETDIAFNFALNLLTELRNENRLEVIHFQEAFLISSIQSNVESKPDCFGAGMSAKQRTSVFSNGLGTVLRHLMLNATGIPDNLWPLHHHTQRNLMLQRNHDNMRKNFRPPAPIFQLTTDEDAMYRYLGSYDQQFPHYKVQHIINSATPGNLAHIHGMILSLRFNPGLRLREIVEIRSTAGATEDAEDECRMANSHARVVCIVRKVVPTKADRRLEQVKSLIDDDNRAKNYKKFDKLISKCDKDPCNIDQFCKQFSETLNIDSE